MSKVFVIDDSVSVCVAIERMLGDHGFDVVWEKDPIAALNSVEKHAPDLIICDVILPEIDGFEICASLRANPLLDGTPVILISGVITEEVRSRARAADAAAIIEKPFTAEQLIETVQAHLEVTDVPPKDLQQDDASRAKSRSMAIELDSLAELGSRYACILDRQMRIVAATGAAREMQLTPAIENELRRLAYLASESSQDSTDRVHGRLTIENSRGVQMVDLLDDGHLLLISLTDPRSLGKARFLTRRLCGRLAGLLST